jgi:hypothetical protein
MTIRQCGAYHNDLCGTLTFDLIKYNGKCLVKVNWIKSGIIFINDILDEYGRISEYKTSKNRNLNG